MSRVFLAWGLMVAIVLLEALRHAFYVDWGGVIRITQLALGWAIGRLVMR